MQLDFLQIKFYESTKLKHYRRKWNSSFLSGESNSQSTLVAPNLECRFKDHLDEITNANICESIFLNCKALQSVC